MTATKRQYASDSSTTVRLKEPTTAGNLLVGKVRGVASRITPGSWAIQSHSDETITDEDGFEWNDLWAYVNVQGGISSVTATFPAPELEVGIKVEEWTGVASIEAESPL